MHIGFSWIVGLLCVGSLWLNVCMCLSWCCVDKSHPLSLCAYRAAVKMVSSLFRWPLWGGAPSINNLQKGSHCGGLLGLNSLGSIYCDGLCLAFSLCLYVTLLRSLSPAGPRARQSALQTAWQLHNILCSSPGLFLWAAPPPSCCCWVPQVRFAAAPFFLISHVFMRISSSPPPLLSCPAL